MEPTIKEKLAYILKHLEPILAFECPYCGCITSDASAVNEGSDITITCDECKREFKR